MGAEEVVPSTCVPFLEDVSAGSQPGEKMCQDMYGQYLQTGDDRLLIRIRNYFEPCLRDLGQLNSKIYQINGDGGEALMEAKEVLAQLKGKNPTGTDAMQAYQQGLKYVEVTEKKSQECRQALKVYMAAMAWKVADSCQQSLKMLSDARGKFVKIGSSLMVRNPTEAHLESLNYFIDRRMAGGDYEAVTRKLALYWSAGAGPLESVCHALKEGASLRGSMASLVGFGDGTSAGSPAKKMSDSSAPVESTADDMGATEDDGHEPATDSQSPSSSGSYTSNPGTASAPVSVFSGQPTPPAKKGFLSRLKPSGGTGGTLGGALKGALGAAMTAAGVAASLPKGSGSGSNPAAGSTTTPSTSSTGGTPSTTSGSDSTNATSSSAGTTGIASDAVVQSVVTYADGTSTTNAAVTVGGDAAQNTNSSGSQGTTQTTSSGKTPLQSGKNGSSSSSSASNSASTVVAADGSTGGGRTLVRRGLAGSEKASSSAERRRREIYEDELLQRDSASPSSAH